MQDKELQLEDTVSADRKERMIYVGPGKSRKISSITSRQNFDNEKFTRNKNKGGDDEEEGDDKEKVEESTIQSAAPDQSDTIKQDKNKKSNSPQIEFVTGTEKAGSSSTAIGNAQNMGIKKISEALVKEAMKKVKGDVWDDKNPPFEPDTKAEKEFKKPHNPNRSPMDTVRALAQKAMAKQKGIKEEVETIDEKSLDTSKLVANANKPENLRPKKDLPLSGPHKAPKIQNGEHEVKKVDEALLPVVKSAFSKLKDKFSSKPAAPAPATSVKSSAPASAPNPASKPATPAAKPALKQTGKSSYNYSDGERRAHMAKGGTFDGTTGKKVAPKPAATSVKSSAPAKAPNPASKPASSGPTPGKPTIDKDGGYNYHDDDRKAHMAKGGKFDGNTGKMLKHGEKDSAEGHQSFEDRAKAVVAKHLAKKAEAEKAKAASAPKPEPKPAAKNDDHEGHDMIKAAIAAKKSGGDPHKAALDHLTKSNPNLAKLMAMHKDGKSGVVKEEIEDLQELDTSTLKSYINKANPEVKAAKAERQSAREGGDLQTADSARRTADKRTAGIKQAKAKLNKEGQEMKTYQEFLDQLLEYTPGPGGVTRVQGRSYGAQYHDPEGDDDADDKAPAAKAADAPKRGRGRPAGSKSGANQKVTTGKSYGGIATHSLHLPNSK